MRQIVFILLFGFFQSALALDAPPDLQFDVVRFEVTGSNPFPPEVISKILNPFLGRHYGLDGLSAAVSELERELKKQGYSFHRVILEPQSLQQGIVRLQVYEFKLGHLKISGNKFFSEENIKASLPGLVEGHAPNTRLLNQSLSIANEHPDKALQMIFKEGEKQNTVDVDLMVADKSPHTSYAQLANTGSKDSGEIRLGIGYQYSNLFNKDHIASINYSTSTEQPENVAQWVLSYSFPFYETGDQMSVYYSDSAIAAISPSSVGDLDINGAGTVLGTRYMMGFKKIKGYKQKLFYGFDYKNFDNQILLGTTTVSGTNEVKSAPVSVEYEISHPTGITQFTFDISFHQNLLDDQDAYDLEARKPDTYWNLLRYRANYQMSVQKWLLRLNVEGQYATVPLISGEQFGVGGSRSVRGYNEREILGDRGIGLSFEAGQNVEGTNLRWLVFYDVAQTEYVEDFGTGVSQSLIQDAASIGGGVRWSWNRYFNASADLAQVLEDFGDTESGDIKLHFNMTYQY